MKEGALGFSFCGVTGHVPGASGAVTPEDLLLDPCRLGTPPPPASYVAAPCSAGKVQRALPLGWLESPVVRHLFRSEPLLELEKQS